LISYSIAGIIKRMATAIAATGIATARKALRVSQIRLARISRVSRFRIALFEVGDGCLTGEEVDRIRHALLAEAQRLQAIQGKLGLIKSNAEEDR
jgi:hypothetical protein